MNKLMKKLIIEFAGVGGAGVCNCLWK